MKLAKFREIVEVNSLAELHEHLCFRHQTTFGSFWLWHDSGTKLALMVNDSDACIIFFFGERNPGFQSINARTNSPDEEVAFLADNYEPTPMSRYFTVPLSQAISVVDEFYTSGQHSKNIDWCEL